MEISVIIPVFNAEHFIAKAVESALFHSHISEVLLIEDGSTDNSMDVCLELSRKYENVTLLKHKDSKNNGAASARNLGLMNAKCEYIAFLDADDFYLKNRFESTLESFVSNKNAIGIYEAVQRIFYDTTSEVSFKSLYGNEVLIKANKVIKPYLLFEEIFLNGQGIIHLNGLVIKKSIISKVGYFDEELLLGQDTDWILRLSLAGDLFPGKQDKPICHSVVHGKNSVLNWERFETMKWLFYQKWFNKMLESSFPKNVNRKIVNSYLYYHPLIKNQKKTRIFRLLFKIIGVSFLLISKPKLIKKII